MVLHYYGAFKHFCRILLSHQPAPAPRPCPCPCACLLLLKLLLLGEAHGKRRGRGG